MGNERARLCLRDSESFEDVRHARDRGGLLIARIAKSEAWTSGEIYGGVIDASTGDRKYQAEAARE